MKKLILTLAFALTAALTAQAQPVYSNVVGMIKTSIPAGDFQIVALPLSGSETSVLLDDAFGDVVNGTVLYVWDGEGYVDYQYLDFLGGWVNSSNVPVGDSVSITQGTSVWLKSGGSETTLVHSGNVPESATTTINFTQGFTLISSPYPANLLLGDLDVTDIRNGDTIFIWTEAGYADYQYLNFLGGWVNSSNVPVGDTVSIPAGSGAWLKSQISGSILINKPY